MMMSSPNLRQWMNNNNKPITTLATTTATTAHEYLEKDFDVLILDGGISTHLEQLILQEQKCSSTATSRNKNDNNKKCCAADDASDDYSDDSAITKTSTNENGGGAFQYRSLWSSSLLLNLSGQNLIKKSHESFLDSGCDIISTVTYQVSYHICTNTSASASASASASHQHEHSNEEECTVGIPKLSHEDVDNLLSTGIQLAHESRIRTMMKRKQKSTTTTTTLDTSNDSSIANCYYTKPVYIIGSLGCYGAALADGSEYRGDYKIGIDEIMHFHKRRFHVMMDWVVEGNNTRWSPSSSSDDGINTIQTDQEQPRQQHIDGIAFETVPNIVEVEAIIKVVQERMNQSILPQDKKIAIWLSLACQNDRYLNDGTLVTDVLNILDNLDSDGYICGIGVNCFDVKNATSLTKVIATHQVESKLNRAIIFYPNSGEEWDAVNESWLEGSGCTDCTEFADYTVNAVQSIQSIYKRKHKPCRIIVGGCCRTSPSTIQQLRQQLDKQIIS